MTNSGTNRLYWLCAIGGILVGLFLLLGAWGHFEAVKATIFAEENPRQFALLLPGFLLASAGLLNLALCKMLWDGNRTGQKIAIAGNLLVLVYLIYLLWTGVPDHPVATFTAVVSCYVVLLVVTAFGLSWPAQD